MGLLIQAIVDGLTNGSAYALMATGLVMYYRSSRIINLAHGESFVVAALSTLLATRAGLPLILGITIGLLISALLAVAVERILIRPRLDWSPSMIVILTLGLAFLLRGIFRIIGGTSPYSSPYLINLPVVRLGPAVTHPQSLLLIGVTVIVGLGLVALFRATSLGKAMTAAAENPMASQLVGINIDGLRMASFGIAGLLGGIAAALIVPLSFVDYSRGLSLVLQGFVAAALASMFYPGRAIIAGLALGVMEGLVATYANPLYRTPFVFGVVLLAALIYLSRAVSFGGAARA